MERREMKVFMNNRLQSHIHTKKAASQLAKLLYSLMAQIAVRRHETGKGMFRILTRNHIV